MSVELAILKDFNSQTYKAAVQLVSSTTYLDDIPVSTAIPPSALVIGNRIILAIPGDNPRDAVIIATWPQGTPGGGIVEHGNEYHNPDFATETALTSHTAATSAHGATPDATPSTIVLRDSAGRAKFAAPAAAGDALIRGTAITDTEHGSRGSGLHADSHARQHALDSASDHTGTITDTQHGSRGSGLHADSHPRSHDHSQAADGSPIALAGVPNLPASKITSERFTMARMPDGTAGHVLTAQGPGNNPVYAAPTGGGDLFAITRFLRPARYHTIPFGSTTTLTLASNTLYAIPFFTPITRTITRIAIHVTTAATGTPRIGAYTDNGSVYPASLILDAGTLDTSTTGLKETATLNLPLNANTLYWLALLSNTTATIAATTAGLHWSLLGYGTALNVVGSGHYTIAQSYGSMPPTFPSGATPATAAIPKIAVYFT